MSYKATVSLLIFCLEDLSIDVNGVLKSPPMMILLSVYPFMSVNISFSRVSNLQPMGHMRPKMAMNVAQHKIVNLLKTLLSFILSFITEICTFSILVIANLGPAQ